MVVTPFSRWRTSLFLPCLLLLADLSVLAGPPGIVRFPPVRGFLDEGPANLTLVGTGVRIREGIPFYTVGYYVHLTDLRALAGPGPYDWRELAKLLIEGKVAQGLVTRFHQPVGKARRVEFLVVNLKRWWPEPRFDEGNPSVRQFVAFFDEPLARGEETQVWFRGGVAFTRKPGKSVHRTPDRSISRAFLGSYLGGQVMEGAEHPLQQDLLKGLPDLLQNPANLSR